MNTQFINALYLIDSRISLADRERLIAGLPVDGAWALIEETEDGVGQIRDIVSSYSGLGALHLIGHGSPGSLLLGAGSIDLASINQMAAVWAQIGTSLSQNGDILLYGSNTAQGQAGLDTLEQLARITSADIAASVDQTGAAGNWVLEASTGSIEAATLSVPGFQSTLDTVGIGSLRTTSRKPTIMGSVALGAGRTLEVEIGGKVYKDGDGKLSVDSSAHTWTLNLGSETSDLAVGSYDVKARVIDAGPAAPTPISGSGSVIASNPSVVNQITGSSSDDNLSGASRADVAVFSGNRSDYTITAGTTSIKVTDKATGVEDTLTNLNQLKFADGQEFVLAASERVALSGTNTVTLTGGSVVNGVDVTASKLYNGTKAAETFVVAKNVSAMILAGAGDTVDLIGRITDYAYTAKGSQLQISDGAYTTTINIGGNVTLRTASGSYAVTCSYTGGTPTITLGNQAVNGGFSASSTTTSASTLSSNAESIVSDATASELVVNPYGLVQQASTVTPIAAKSAFYEGVGTISLQAGAAKSYTQVTQAATNASTVLDTANGALIGVGNYGNGRVAVVNSNGNNLWQSLQVDPAQGGMSRGFFNLFSWLANEQRTVGQHDKLHILSTATPVGLSANSNQALFWEYLWETTSYSDPANASTTQIDADAFADYPAADRYVEALMPNGTWSRNYDVVVLSSSALSSEVQLVRQWMSATGGGVLVKHNGGTMSAAVTQLLADVGLSVQQGANLAAGDYTPTMIDPKSSDVVRAELMGQVATSGTVSKPIYIRDDVDLPTEIMGGQVRWQSLNHAVMSDDGRVLGTGSATLRAVVTFADGTTQTQDVVYQAWQPVGGTGLSLRIVDATGFTVNGATPADTTIDAFLSSSLMSKTPIYTATVNQLNWTTATASAPAATNGKSTLWLYSGELVAPVSGSYTFKLTADDSARFYIDGGTTTSTISATWGNTSSGGVNVTVNLAAGESYPLWVFFKPSNGGGNNIHLTWQQPGASSFSEIPDSALALPPTGLLSASAGYPLDYLPFGSSTSGGPSLSSTQIISIQAQTSLEGNQPPVANDQTFSFAEQDIYCPSQNLVLTDAVAGQAKSLSIKMSAGTGSTKNIELINLPLSGVTNGATLAQQVQAALNAANTADAANAITVSYANQTLVIADTEGRSVSNFILGKDAALAPTMLSGARTVVTAGQEAVGSTPATPSVSKIHFTGDAVAANRLALSLDSADNSKDVMLIDLAHWGLGFGDKNTFAQYLQEAIAARGVGVTVSWDAANNDLVFTDPVGRSFTNLELYTTSKYEPLVSYGGDSSIISGSTITKLGDLAGQVQATDLNGDALTYTVLESGKFGTVALDASTGKWTYTPTSGDIFKGYDQFTVSVSDGYGGTSAPVAVTISDQAAPQVSMPIAHVYTVADPVYVEPVAKGNAVPTDMVFRDVFVAQTHVERPSDPYLVFTSNRSVLIKVNATSATRALAPDMVATVTDKNGNVLGSLRLTGPDHLPTTVDLPSASNLGVQTNADSYVASLPSAWVQPGISITVTAGGNTTPLTSFSPNVGADAQLTVRDLGLSMFDNNQYGYITGMGSWAQEAVAKLPVQSLKLYEYPAITMDRYGKEQSGNWGVWTGTTSGVPGTDPIFGGGYQADISYAIHLAGSLKNANFLGTGSGSTMAYVGFSPGAGGGLGGGSIGGGDATPGILWHEFAGHGSGRPHAATDSSYPYNSMLIEGVTTQEGTSTTTPGFLGPNWGYDQVTGTYLPNYYVSGGTTYLATDPMAGGDGQQAQGYVFQQFSDYYTLANYNYIIAQTQWVSDPSQNAVDGGFAGDGYFKSWDTTNKQWVVWTAANYAQVAGGGRAPVADLPHLADVPVYWLSFSIVDQHGVAARPGVTYASDLEVLPVRTLGNLTEPFHDILTGAGRAADINTLNGDYVMRVTYATATGLITDNLIIPSNYGLLYAGFNVADKGELVRVDIVEAENANVSAYLNNKVVASYVNSEALANTVFRGDPYFFAQDQALTLPKYWNGSEVTWSSNVAGLVNLANGVIDQSKLTAGAAIRAQWVENGALHTESFVLKLPDTVYTKHLLFGGASDAVNGTSPTIALSDLTLPGTIDDGTVVWSSSNPSVLDNTGHLLGNGTTTLTATVTWSNGAVQTFSEKYSAVKLGAGDMGGMQLRVYSTEGMTTFGTSNDTVTSTTLDQYFSVLSNIPIYSGTGALPDIAVKNDGNGTGTAPNFYLGGVTMHPNLTPASDPSAVVRTGQPEEALWEYSGYYVAPSTGSYTFAFSADQIGRLYMNVGSQQIKVDSWIHNINDKTVTVSLAAGQAVPMWIFFKTQTPGGYWADWVSLKVKLPGASDFSAIPGSALAPMTDASVQPFAASSSAAYTLATSQVGSNTFTALGTQAATQLTQAWSIVADTSEDVVVSGASFEQSVGVPAELAGVTMQHWVKLVLKNAAGAIFEQDPLENWQISTKTSVSGTVLSVKGTIDSTPGLDIVGIKVYSDDNLLDATSPAVVNFPLNQGPVGLLMRGHVDEYTIVNGTGADEILNHSADTTALAMRGASGNDTLTGGSAADVIDGGAGNDTVNGGAGNDRLLLSAGTDALHGQQSGASGETNSLVLVVSDLNHAVLSSTTSGMRLVSADDDIDMTLAKTGADQLTAQGTWLGAAANTTADGIQVVEITDGTTTDALVVGTAGADTLAVSGLSLANTAYFYAGSGADTLQLSVAKPSVADGGDGADIAQLDWVGLLSDMTGKTISLSIEPGTTDTYHVNAADGSGSIRLLDLVRNGSGANDYTVEMHLNTGTLVSHHLVNVEQVQLSGLNYALTLSATSVVV